MTVGHSSLGSCCLTGEIDFSSQGNFALGALAKAVSQLVVDSNNSGHCSGLSIKQFGAEQLHRGAPVRLSGHSEVRENPLVLV